MDLRKEVRDFLVGRRARISPGQAGLPDDVKHRRVPGLRREEVANLAGVSVDYYTRMERGDIGGASDAVLNGLATALQLDEAERQHLHTLARGLSALGSPRSRHRGASGGQLRPSVRATLHALTVPAYVRNRRRDILAANELCVVLFDGVLASSRLPVNLARFVFLDPESRGLFAEWDRVADSLAGALRAEVGANPGDGSLADLVSDLIAHSDAFAARWARHGVVLHRTDRKVFRNSLVGDIHLIGDVLEVPGEHLSVVTFTQAPDGLAADRLARLAERSRSADDVPGDDSSAEPS